MSNMMYFLLVQVAIAAAAKPEVVNLDTTAPAICPAHPFVDDVPFSSLDVDDFCLQPVVVPPGKAAQVYFANREAYCSQLSVEEQQLAQITEADGTVVNFCTSAERSFSLTSGTHYIGVAPAQTPLRVSLTYYDTHLGCDDRVDDALVGIPLAFVPTRHDNCGLVLPSRTVMTITNIKRTPTAPENSRHCVRVRMGKTWNSLNMRWKPVCEVPASDSLEYYLGCGSVVLDASSLVIEKVSFILREMDDLQSVTAPLMCSTDEDKTSLQLNVEAKAHPISHTFAA